MDLTDDLIDEDDEIFLVTLGTVENATKDIPDVHTWTIVDNDDPPDVFFTWEEQSADESVDTMTVEVQLETASSKEVTVPFSVGGTATRGSDYTIDSTPLVIPAGELTASTDIHVIEDSGDEELDETIVLTILAPTNVFRGDPYVHTATIVSLMEEPTVFFSPASQSGDEGIGTLVFSARLSAASALDVTVPSDDPRDQADKRQHDNPEHHAHQDALGVRPFVVPLANKVQHKHAGRAENDFCERLKGEVASLQGKQVEVAVAPPFTAISAAAQALQGSPISMAAQDVFWAESGAYTGEISVRMLKDAGCRMAIIGHSERRHYFHETDEAVNKKAAAVMKEGLVPIVCVGETLSEAPGRSDFFRGRKADPV